jgi:hypothetical protein
MGQLYVFLITRYKRFHSKILFDEKMKMINTTLSQNMITFLQLHDQIKPIVYAILT